VRDAEGTRLTLLITVEAGSWVMRVPVSLVVYV
jgi:hypothetical protein